MKNFYGEAEKEISAKTPAEGYNIFLYDSMGKSGEMLDYACYHDTMSEAMQAKLELEAAGSPTVYVLGVRDKITELPTAETVSIPSSLSNQDVLAKTRYRESTPYPYDDQHIKNYVATGSKKGQEPSMHNEEGWVGSKQIPEWPFDIEQYRPQIQEAYKGLEVIPMHTGVKTRWARYIYQRPHDRDDVCQSFGGKVFDMKKEAGRPVPPSEGRGYTTTHPNCKCYWEEEIDYDEKQDKISSNAKEHIKDVRRKIGQRARRHTLHTVHQDGKLSNRTRGTSPLQEILKPIREAILGLQSEFQWMTPEYIQRIINVRSQVGGAFFLIRASGETVTDHRAEGDQYRRLLTGNEIHSFARTGIGKGLDVNHIPSLRTQGVVMDGDYDPDRREMQLLVHERDPEIIAAVANGTINEVSINGGLPRRQDIDCTRGECFVVPIGVVLGELDGIALTYVVSDPHGFQYKGQWLAPKKAGVKTTAIEIL